MAGAAIPGAAMAAVPINTELAMSFAIVRMMSGLTVA
jgi:hypothetical protein